MSYKDTSINTLMEMLTYPRPHGSMSEAFWREKFILDRLDHPMSIREDSAGNLIYQVGENPNILFSGHTDTVHKEEAQYCCELGDDVLTNANLAPLGADDGTGVWLMMEMIAHGVEGLYIFHYGEEVGGVGSSYIATVTPEILDDIDFAIAFDRKGTKDVITHQMERCASDAFALDLAKRIGGGYKPDDSGVFTDTAKYTELVAECTNLSVGYGGEHTASEYQDLRHAAWLRDRLVHMDWSNLTCQRAPGEDDPRGMNSYLFDFEPTDGQPMSWQDLYRMVMEDPKAAADILEDVGITWEDADEYDYPDCF